VGLGEAVDIVVVCQVKQKQGNKNVRNFKKNMLFYAVGIHNNIYVFYGILSFVF